MTPEQLEELDWLISDPDWDVSQRNDAWQLLQVMQAELRDAATLAARPSAPSVTQALIDAGINLHNTLDDNSIGHEWLCENWRKALLDYEKSTPAPQAEAVEVVKAAMSVAKVAIKRKSVSAVIDLYEIDGPIFRVLIDALAALEAGRK